MGKAKPETIVSSAKGSFEQLSDNKLISPVDAPRKKKSFHLGRVRASPYGSCLDSIKGGEGTAAWEEWRTENLKPLKI